MAEQLAFNELRRHRAAVERQERRLASPAQFMQRQRRQLLARAAFTQQQHRRGSRRDPGQLVVQQLHGRRAAQQPAEAPQPPQFVPQRANLIAQRGGLARVSQHRLHPVKLRRLYQIVRGARPQGGHRTVHRGVAGHHDQLRGILRGQFPGQFNAPPRQADAGPSAPHPAACGRAVRGRPSGSGTGGSETLQARDLLQPPDHVRVVVDNEGMGHGRAFHGSGAAELTVDIATAVLLTAYQCLTRFSAPGRCNRGGRQQNSPRLAPLQGQLCIQVVIVLSSGGRAAAGRKCLIWHINCKSVVR